MGLREDCERTIKESIEGLGGLDVIVSNAVSISIDRGEFFNLQASD